MFGGDQIHVLKNSRQVLHYWIIFMGLRIWEKKEDLSKIQSAKQFFWISAQLWSLTVFRRPYIVLVLKRGQPHFVSTLFPVLFLWPGKNFKCQLIHKFKQFLCLLSNILRILFFFVLLNNSTEILFYLHFNTVRKIFYHSYRKHNWVCRYMISICNSYLNLKNFQRNPG